MNRRKFAKNIIGGIGLSLVAGQTVHAAKHDESTQPFEAGHQMQTPDGLKMTLSAHSLPTHDQDRQQFILTFDVHNNTTPLTEKIYRLTDHKGQNHDIFMSPVGKQKLQALFNWRTHA